MKRFYIPLTIIHSVYLSRLPERVQVELKKASVLGILILFCFFFPKYSWSQTNTVPFFNESFSVDYEEKIAQKFDDGISDFFTGYTEKVVGTRNRFWNRRFESPEDYNLSVEKNRSDLKKILGNTDSVYNVRLVTVTELGQEEKNEAGKVVGETRHTIIYRVKWTVHNDLLSEGLLVIPKGKVNASVVIVPDADELPEQYAGLEQGSQLAITLAENGFRVLIPVLVSRTTQYSGSDNLYPSIREWMANYTPAKSNWTNEPAREWIWRQGFVMGKSIIGIEVQKVEAAISWFKQNPAAIGEKIGVMGYREGGLIALYAAALDTRIDVAWVSGYFGPRENLWNEPVSRNLWGLLNEFGDAEIASMVIPRSLIIEASPVQHVKFPLTPQKEQRNFGLPGELNTPAEASVKTEVQRLKGFFPDDGRVRPDITLIDGVQGHATDRALAAFSQKLNIPIKSRTVATSPLDVIAHDNTAERQRRVFNNMQDYIQNMIPVAEHKREIFMPGDYTSPRAWEKKMDPYRNYFYDEIIGRVDEKLLPVNPRIRLIYDEPEWTGYEVALDVWPGVYAWGILAVPKGINKGEKRPAVVMQHGNGGLPTTSLLVDHYHGVLRELAKKGFVAFSPYNSYFFNIRKAQAVKANAFSVIIPQYRQIVNYLKSLSYVDGDRMALYGKSWGGWTALNVPAVIKDFKVSVCVGYYNDWLKKAVSNKFSHSYFYENSLCIYNWNMGNTILHAELAKMILPRPFMVVAGLNDGVARPEDVAFEFEKVKLVYQLLGISDKAAVDFWVGKHEIDLKTGGIPFLVKYLMNGTESEMPKQP